MYLMADRICIDSTSLCRRFAISWPRRVRAENFRHRGNDVTRNVAASDVQRRDVARSGTRMYLAARTLDDLLRSSIERLLLHGRRIVPSKGQHVSSPAFS